MENKYKNWIIMLRTNSCIILESYVGNTESGVNQYFLFFFTIVLLVNTYIFRAQNEQQESMLLLIKLCSKINTKNRWSQSVAKLQLGLW